jgi:hypothetical protein
VLTMRRMPNEMNYDSTTFAVTCGICGATVESTNEEHRRRISRAGAARRKAKVSPRATH